MAGVVFLFIGKTKEGFIRDGIEKYARLAGHYLPVDIREIKGATAKDPDAAKEEEAESVLGRLSPGDIVVLLDEHGKNPVSVDFAAEMGRLIEQGRRTVFVIGGPFGLSDKLRRRADYLLSLSRLTFTHEMARLILLEQVYRAMTILKGKTYHY